MTLRRIPVWVGYTTPSDQEAAAGIDGADVIGVGLVLDLSTGQLRLSDGRTDYDDLPVVDADLDIGDLTAGDGTVTLSGGGEVRFYSLSAPFATVPAVGFRIDGASFDSASIGAPGMAFGSGLVAEDVGIGWDSANRAKIVNPAGGNAWLTLPADPVNSTDAARKSWVDTQVATRAASSHTHTASEVTDFNTAVRTNRIDQMAVPTSNMSWPGSSLVAGGIGAASSTATDGAVSLFAIGGIGGLLQVKANSSDTTATVQLNGGSVSLGVGGSTAPDVTFSRTGTGAASITVTTLTVAANMVMSGRTISTGTGTGLIIGTGPTQKVGLWGTTAVVQPSGAAQAAVTTTAATQTTPWGYSTQAQADGIITLLNAMRSAMVALGSMKGSA